MREEQRDQKDVVHDCIYRWTRHTPQCFDCTYDFDDSHFPNNNHCEHKEIVARRRDPIHSDWQIP